MISPLKIKGSFGGRPLLLKKMDVSEFEVLQAQTLKGEAPYDWLWIGYTPQAGGGRPFNVFIYVSEDPEKVELPDIDSLTLASKKNTGEW